MIKIDKNIPIPEMLPNLFEILYKHLEIGDSFEISTSHVSCICSCEGLKKTEEIVNRTIRDVNYCTPYEERKNFTYRTSEDKKSIRVWRIK